VIPPVQLILRKTDSVDLTALSMDLYRIRTAVNVFDLLIPLLWQDRMKVVGDTIGMLNHFDPAQEPNFQYLASGFQGESEKPYLLHAQQFRSMGLSKPASVIEAYCALASDVDLDLEAFENDEDNQPEDIDDDLREQLKALQNEWVSAIQGIKTEILRDYLTKDIPVRFLSDAEFDAYWVGQICSSARFKALPGEPLWSQHAERWRTYREAENILVDNKIVIFYTIWTEHHEDRQTASSIVASNRGLLRVYNNRRIKLHRLESWPDGEFILDFPLEKKLETTGPLDVPARLKYNGIDRRLSEAYKIAPKWPLRETRFVLANLRDVMRREYLSATLGISNKTLFAPLVNVAMWFVVVAILVFYGDPRGDVVRFLEGEWSWNLLLALAAKAIFLPWALVEIYWRIIHFGALLRGTIVRCRGKAPMHDSFGGTSFGHSNIILRLFGHRSVN